MLRIALFLTICFLMAQGPLLRDKVEGAELFGDKGAVVELHGSDFIAAAFSCLRKGEISLAGECRLNGAAGEGSVIAATLGSALVGSLLVLLGTVLPLGRLGAVLSIVAAIGALAGVGFLTVTHLGEVSSGAFLAALGALLAIVASAYAFGSNELRRWL